jgi:hypothetical protein
MRPTTRAAGRAHRRVTSRSSSSPTWWPERVVDLAEGVDGDGGQHDAVRPAEQVLQCDGSLV